VATGKKKDKGGRSNLHILEGRRIQRRGKRSMGEDGRRHLTQEGRRKPV